MASASNTLSINGVGFSTPVTLDPFLWEFKTASSRSIVIASRSERRKLARPSNYAPEIVEAICERLEKGEALAAICRDDAMPGLRTFLRWADEKEEVGTAYSLALRARAEFFEAEHTRIADTAKDRDTAAAARVQLAALEWRMSKLAPKRYGDRLDLNVDHSFDLSAVLDKGRQRVLEANARLGLPSDAEP